MNKVLKKIGLLMLLLIGVTSLGWSQDDTIFTIVEESAQPKGGMESFYKHVQNKLKYPAEARRNGVEGRVYVEFIVEKDGSISNVKSIKGIGFGCDEEAVNAVASSTKWIPGTQEGKPVKQKIVLPLTFELDGKIETTSKDKEEETNYFVKLNNGEKVVGDQIKYKSRSLGKPHFDVDGQRFEFFEVKAYQNQNGYFLKATPEGAYSPSFYLRELQGTRIDTYSITTTSYSYSPGAPGMYGGGGMGTFSTHKVGYYVKNNGSMRKLNYQNLNRDLTDHTPSAMKLKEVKRAQTIQGVIIGAGVATFIAGIAATANTAKNNESLPPSERDVSLSPLLFVGPAMIGITVMIGKGSKEKKMLEAIKLYNQ